MGVNIHWKNIIQREFSGCFIQNLPDGVTPTVIIDDWTLNLWKIITGAESGDDVVKRGTDRLKLKYAPSLERYIICFDEDEYKPSAKQKTQSSRVERQKKSGNEPFTKKEIETYNIRVENSCLPHIGKLMNTGFLRMDLCRFLTREMLKWRDDYFDKVTLEIDGAREYIHGTKIPSSGSHKFRPPCENTPGTEVPTVIHSDSNRIGESDLKIVAHINRMSPGSVIYVRSSDTDVIFILLLNMRNWIDPTTKSIDRSIYVEGGKEGILDVVALWKKVSRTFHRDYKHTEHYIETFVSLVILSGCDFLDNFDGVGPATIWNNFKEHGNNHLCHDGSFIIFKNDTLCIGDPEKRTSIQFKEHKLFRFFKWLFTDKLLPTTKRKRGEEGKIKSNGTLKGGYSVPNDDEIYSTIRRLLWVMDYWLNGYKPIPLLFMNPIATDPQTGLSLYGYEQVNETNEDGKVSSYVIYAKKVMMFGSQ